ncbi:uncharacterized protein LOC141904645 [Tubulanus polymorphus]|uniref:uncharacterized protein LOC141904645 n=1 Tax=Tubulanus polymorphus TaxID=672921 RepID=UPI003DA4A728
METSIREAQTAKRAVRRTIRLLHEAIARNDLEEVKSIATENVDVNFHWRGQSALQLAVQKGYYEISAFLVKKGADVNKCNAESNSVLNMACWRGLDSIAELLIVSGADVNLPNEQGSTPLNCCCFKGFTDIARMLIRNKNCDLNTANYKGQTPLMTCVRTGNIEMAEELTEAGCELDKADEDHKTPLIVAAEKGNFDLVRMLVYAGCDLNVLDKRNWTALLEAVSNGHLLIVQELLNAGAKVNTVSHKGISPLLEAVMKEHKQIAKLLIQHRSDLNIASHLKQTPLHIAVRQATHYFGSDSNGNDMVRALVLAKCNINLPDNEGWTALYQSVFGGDIAISKFLLDHKADISVKTNKNDSLLHGAVFGNKVEIVKMLIDAGCDVNAKNHNSEIPLYLAVNFKSDIQIIKLLIAAGSDLDITENTNNQTIAMAAVLNRYPEALEILLEAGCDCNIANSSGATVLYEACIKGDEQMLAMLLARPGINVDGTLSHIPLLTAVEHNNHLVLEKLLEAGCDVNIVNSDGLNAMFFAAETNSLRMVRVLLRWGFDLDSVKDNTRLYSCCKQYDDSHPHMELNPLYVAIRHDNFKMFLTLISAHYKVPYHDLDLLHDLVFKTGYAAEANVSPHILAIFKEIFAKTARSPMTLQHISRGVIRQSLAQRPHLKVDRLPIPTKLKEYILMKDVLWPR